MAKKWAADMSDSSTPKYIQLKYISQIIFVVM